MLTMNRRFAADLDVKTSAIAGSMEKAGIPRYVHMRFSIHVTADGTKTESG